MRRKEGVIVRWDEKKWYVDSDIQSSRVYEDEDECDKNNNLLFEYAANSTTSTINHFML